MADLNVVFLIGRLTRDPDLRYTSGGTPVTEIGLAVNRGYGERQEVYFASVVVWGKVAEWITSKVRKGSAVHVEGHLTRDEYTDRSGAKQSRTRITADRIQPLETAQAAAPAAAPAPGYQPPAPLAGGGIQYDSPEPDDIPF